MATQSLEFGYTTGQAASLTAKLFEVGSDVVVATATGVTEAVNRLGRYVAAFEDVPAGTYLMVYYLSGVGAGSEKYTLTLTTATFQPLSEQSMVADVLAGLASVEIQRISPFNAVEESFELIRGDDYVLENDQHTDLSLVGVTGVDFETATVEVWAVTKRGACERFEGFGSIVGPATATPKVRVEWPEAGKGKRLDDYTWHTKLVDAAGNTKTPYGGDLTLVQNAKA